MKLRFTLGALAAMLLMAGVASAAITSAADFLNEVQQRLDRGEITADEALLLKFQYCLDRDKLPADLQPETLAPMKCATELVMEFQAGADRMDPTIAGQIEAMLALPDDPSRLTYNSPSGKFRITYYTTGTSAVPTYDGNSNGIPDYVENIGAYLDFSYQTECVDLGFHSPPFSASYPYMNIYIAALDGVYGYTQPITIPPGMTRITLDNDYVGFPPNDDPDGDVAGAAKVTCAHEFKHSCQYAGSRWSEDGWVEVDATWTEDIVYPATNDYLNYLSFGSPISSPNVSLDGGSTGTGSYEDCVWQHYLSQTYGNQHIVDLWAWRESNFGQAMMDSYEQLINDYGGNLHDVWNDFTAWNFATGARYLQGQGYAEGNLYPTGSAQRTLYSYPSSYSATVPHLAANFIRTLSVAAPGQALRITFDGADTGDMTLAAVVNQSYTTQTGAMYLIPLDANNDVVFDVPYDLDGVYSVGIIVGNAAKDGLNQAYSVTVDRVPFNSTGVGGDVPAFAIGGNYPNPFNPATNIRFTLDAAAPTALDIYDVAGHRVRTLLSANLGVGEHIVPWNGQDDAGRGLPSGTYVARLRSGDRLTTHKLVLAK